MAVAAGMGNRCSSHGHGLTLDLFQVRSTSVPSAENTCTGYTTTPETAPYLHVSARNAADQRQSPISRQRGRAT